MRIDLMSRMRGVDPVEQLWSRRTTAEFDDGFRLDLLSLPDLVAAKKTQRDKDWPMIRRLVEADFYSHRADPTPERVRFWLAQARTPSLLIEVAARWAESARAAVGDRPLLRHATEDDVEGLAEALLEEERLERTRDRAYWEPLRIELESWRRGVR